MTRTPTDIARTPTRAMPRLLVLTAALAIALTGCAAPADSGTGTPAAPGQGTSAPGPDSGPGAGAGAGDGAGSAPAGDPEQLLAAHGLAGMDVTEIIDHLEAMPVAERPADLLASVRHDALVLAGPQGEAEFALPEDRTYLSIAPYVEQTHECFHHSLTTCLGELRDTAVDITIIDAESGEEILAEELTTADNGFLGAWVPRGTAGTIEVAHDGRAGTTEFSTETDAATCITTPQLG